MVQTNELITLSHCFDVMDVTGATSKNYQKGACHAEAQACPEFIEGKHAGKGLRTMLSKRTGHCAV